MDPSRLEGAGHLRVACPYRLLAVVDERPAGDRAGGLGEHAFLFEDADTFVRGQLLDAGLSDTVGVPVRLRILKLYLAQNGVTKVPVVVYELRVDDGPPVLVRSQPASMNWWGSEDEAYGAYATAMHGATWQVIARLNAACRDEGRQVGQAHL